MQQQGNTGTLAKGPTLKMLPMAPKAETTNFKEWGYLQIQMPTLKLPLKNTLENLVEHLRTGTKNILGSFLHLAT